MDFGRRKSLEGKGCAALEYSESMSDMEHIARKVDVIEVRVIESQNHVKNTKKLNRARLSRMLLALVLGDQLDVK